jgi:hypothetical protein
VPAMLDTRHEIPLGDGIARELIGDQHPRGPALPLQELAKQALGRSRGWRARS